MAHLASFSRQHMLKQVYDFLATRLRIHKDDMRLWKFKDEVKVNLSLHYVTVLEMKVTRPL